VDLAAAKIHLDITSSDTSHDLKITTLLLVATRKVENDTQRSLLSRTLKCVLDRFPINRHIDLEFPPVLEVQSVTYIDANGAEQTLSPSTYVVAKEGTNKARVCLKQSEYWPITSEDPESVTVNYTAGAARVDDVEPELFQAVMLLISLFWTNKVPVSSDQHYEVPMNYDWLIGPFRAW